MNSITSSNNKHETLPFPCPDINKTDKRDNYYVGITPTQGGEGTVVTVIAQMPMPPAKLAFNSLLVNTQQMQVRNITTLVAVVPPFQHTQSPTSLVPISICFLARDTVVTETIVVADFLYTSNGNSDNPKSPSPSATQPLIQSMYKSVYHQSSYRHYLTYLSDNNNVLNNFYASSSFGYPIPKYSPQQQQQRQDSSSKWWLIIIWQLVVCTLKTKIDSEFLQPVSPCDFTAHKPSSSVSNNRMAVVANYQPYPGLMTRTHLDIVGDLNSMVEGWSPAEVQAGRRLVQFFIKEDVPNKKLLRCEFQPFLGTPERSSNAILVSCIYWEERHNYYITSVDCIYLLESIMRIRFSIEEKNRIRRNLEGFRPLTIGKSKPDSTHFFKHIMGFPYPKPRNIEKDVKVFSWNTLPFALKKIVTKYYSTFG